MAEDSACELLSKLSFDGDQEQIKSTLGQLHQQLIADGQTSDSYAASIVAAGLLPQLQQLLAAGKEQACVAQVIAELAKHESLRQRCIEGGLIPPLVELLISGDVAVCTQACRSLGNICYDNDNARNAVEEVGGTCKLIDVLRAHLDSSSGLSQLRMTACGFLLNLTNTHETIQGKAVLHGAMEILDQYLLKHSDDESVTQMVLMSIGSLADSDIGKDKLVESHISETIVKLLNFPTATNLQDAIFDQLSILSEIDDIKLQLAKTDLTHHLINLIRSNDGQMDEESQSMIKMAADLTILLLTGDESMELLFEDGKGVIFQECLKWMSSENEHLQMSGALAMGNFARNDAHCLRLVKEKLTSKLLNLLQVTSELDSSMTLQHAVFSALRNLAIPAVNKSIMLKSGILEKVLPFIKTDVTPVQFKLLGLLRMLVDGQESAAKTLGCDTGFVSRVVDFCGVEEHAGVKGEANRLLAWLIKNSATSQVMKCIVGGGGVKYLTTMSTSEHAVMQNEALMALTLISSSIPENACEALVEHSISTVVHKLLIQEDTLAEILHNCLTLVTAMSKTVSLKQALCEAEVEQAVNQLIHHEEAMVNEKAKEVITIFDKA